jgi:hypothetical protein
MQILNAGDGLAGATVRDDAGETLGAGMKRQKLRARPIGDRNFHALRLQIFHDQSLPKKFHARRNSSSRSASRK